MKYSILFILHIYVNNIELPTTPRPLLQVILQHMINDIPISI